MKYRTTEGMSLYFSIANILCTSCWVAYGVMLMNYFIIIPNSIGAFLAVIQLLLFALFGDTLHLANYLPIYNFNKLPGRSSDEVPLNHKKNLNTIDNASAVV